MKKLFPLLAIILACSFVSAQVVIFTDDFESYTTDQSIPAQTTNWSTWDPAMLVPASFVSTEQSHSPSKAMKVIPENDMIYDFEGKTAGQYQVSFWIYVAAGKTGYFNIEHEFSTEWAFECYFENGILRIENGETTTYPYPTDSWIHIVIDIDLDTDEAKLNLDGLDLTIWPYSNLASGGTYANPKLDVINFYSAAGWEFYVDDFTFTYTVPPGGIPFIVIDTTPIITIMGAPIQLPFSNHGLSELLFSTYVKFAEPSISSTLVAGTMNCDEDNTSAVGWQNSCDVYAAVRFQNDKTSMHIGQEIVSVDVFINELPVGDVTVYVWSKGGYITPGTNAVLSEKTATPVAHSWNTVTLTTPVRVTGDEIWVGYKFTTPAGGNTLGVDNAAVVPKTNYLKTDAEWVEYTENGNFNIRANVSGAGWPVWLGVSPHSGCVDVWEDMILILEFNTEELPLDTYSATVVIGSNDPYHQWSEIPVTLTFDVGFNNITKIGIITYPNPATQNINVVSDANISSISVFSISGQFINSYKVNATSTSIDVSSMPSGMYVMEINTGNGIVKSKFVVK